VSGRSAGRRRRYVMKTAIPDILKELGESEYEVLSATYCKMAGLRDLFEGLHEAYLATGTPPSLDQITAAGMLLNEAFGPVEKYVLALTEPGEPACGLPYSLPQVGSSV